jgi:hypothetical protein
MGSCVVFSNFLIDCVRAEVFVILFLQLDVMGSDFNILLLIVFTLTFMLSKYWNSIPVVVWMRGNKTKNRSQIHMC